MVVEDADGSRSPVRDRSIHFPIFREFDGASYQRRYDILCQKLTQEKLYTAAATITTPREAIDSGDYSELSELSGLKNFVTLFAGHIAMEAAR